ncbi:MAG: sigma-70 family RNA polymerase sigma factor [Bryobacteraceae bacterium]
MSSPSERTGPGEVTELLLRWNDPVARDKAFAAIYPELKRVAELRMRRERGDHILQPTALVSEVFLHMVRQDSASWQSRSHFLAVASEAMRRILVDHARNRQAKKRPSGSRLSFDEIQIGSDADFAELLEIDDLLEKLAAKDARAARVVEFKYFGGLTFGEIAEILGVSERTAKRDWQIARAWLFTEMRAGGSDEGDDGRTEGAT